MAVWGLKGGTRLRHINGENLLILEDMIASFHYRVEVINVHKVGAQWFVHFNLPQSASDALDVTKEVAAETITKKTRRK